MAATTRRSGALLGDGRGGRPRLELPVGEIVRRYEAGESMATIAQRHHVSLGTIRDRLQEAGVQIRPKNNAHGRRRRWGR